MPLPTLADLKLHLNVSSSSNDAELASILDAAVEVVVGIVGPLSSGAVTETHYAPGSVLLLRQRPVSAVSDVSAPSSPWGGVYAVEDYVLDGEAGLLRSAFGYPFVGPVTVTYTAGRSTVPASVKLAILIIAGHLWETQRGTSPSALALQGDDPGPSFGAGYAIPARAKDLLAQYMRSGQVA